MLITSLIHENTERACYTVWRAPATRRVARPQRRKRNIRYLFSIPGPSMSPLLGPSFVVTDGYLIVHSIQFVLTADSLPCCWFIVWSSIPEKGNLIWHRLSKQFYLSCKLVKGESMSWYQSKIVIDLPSFIII